MAGHRPGGLEGEGGLPPPPPFQYISGGGGGGKGSGSAPVGTSGGTHRFGVRQQNCTLVLMGRLCVELDDVWVAGKRPKPPPPPTGPDGGTLGSVMRPKDLRCAMSSRVCIGVGAGVPSVPLRTVVWRRQWYDLLVHRRWGGGGVWVAGGSTLCTRVLLLPLAPPPPSPPEYCLKEGAGGGEGLEPKKSKGLCTKNSQINISFCKNCIFSRNEIRVRGWGGGGSNTSAPLPPAPGGAEVFSKTLPPPPPPLQRDETVT